MKQNRLPEGVNCSSKRTSLPIHLSHRRHVTLLYSWYRGSGEVSGGIEYSAACISHSRRGLGRWLCTITPSTLVILNKPSPVARSVLVDTGLSTLRLSLFPLYYCRLVGTKLATEGVAYIYTNASTVPYFFHCLFVWRLPSFAVSLCQPSLLEPESQDRRSAPPHLTTQEKGLARC